MSLLKRAGINKACLWCIVAVCVLFLVACGQGKKALTPAAFEELATKSGFSVQDFTGQFEEGLVTSAQMATGEKFQIEYYVLPTEEGAAATFDQNKLTVNKGEFVKSDVREIEEGTYCYYSVVADKQYYVFIKIENAFVYVVAPENEKQLVDEFLQKLT